MSQASAWAFLDGADVCPDCQDDDERQTARRAARSAVRAELERRSREDIPPDEREAAVGAWAMGSGGDPEPASHEPPVTTPRPAPEDRPRHFQVALTAAFFTGVPVEVHLADDDGLRERLACAFTKPGWHVDLPDREGTFEYGGGLKEALPLVLARRSGRPVLDAFRDALQEPSGQSRLDPAELGFSLEPTGVQIEVYDLGVAVMAVWCDVTARGATTSTVRDINDHVDLRRGSVTVEALRALADETVTEFACAIRKAAQDRIRSTWLSKYSPRDRPGRLLWIHPVNVLPDEPAKQCGADAHAPACHTSVQLFTHGWFAAGVGWSSVVGATVADATPAIRLTLLHWAYFALYMEMDRGLLAVLDRGRVDRAAPLGQLEDEAAEVFDDFVRVMEARSRLDSVLTALGGDEVEIWQAIAEAQRFEPVVAAVERKLAVLQRVTERRVELAESDRTRRLAVRLATLSALTLVSVIVATLTYIFGGHSPGQRADVRAVVAAIIVAFTALVIVFWIGRWRPPSLRRRSAATDDHRSSAGAE